MGIPILGFVHRKEARDTYIPTYFFYGPQKSLENTKESGNWDVYWVIHDHERRRWFELNEVRVCSSYFFFSSCCCSDILVVEKINK